MTRITAGLSLGFILLLGAVIAACAEAAPTSAPVVPTVAATSASTGPTAQPAATTGAGAASAEAMAFCAEYMQTCGFGGDLTFASQEACLDAYDNTFDADRRACVETHLDYAAADKAVHCPHAAGGGPCN